MGKQFDRRIAFLKAVEAREIMPTLVLANEWFSRKRAWKLATEEALCRFKDDVDNHRPLL